MSDTQTKPNPADAEKAKPVSPFVLEVEDLRTHFLTDDGALPAVNGVSFQIRRGSTLALVGESGCGKSVTSFSILRLVQKPGQIVGGRIMLHSKKAGDINITKLDEGHPKLMQVRGGLASMIFQEPMTALSPVHTVGDQIAEAILLHQDVTKEEARKISAEQLKKVGIPNPDLRLDQYPHEMSGGMRQRVMIAMALVCKPELLIADEPTTALDVTIQAQILKLIKEMQAEIGCSVLLITHDLGVVAQMADEVAVMYLGRIVEHADVRTVLKRPRHPYTKGLLAALPDLATQSERLYSIPGSVPSLNEIPPGCAYHPRCEHAKKGLCDQGSNPVLRNLEGVHKVACLRVEELSKPTPA